MLNEILKHLWELSKNHGNSFENDLFSSRFLVRLFRKALTEFQLDRDKLYHAKQLEESALARANFVINTFFTVAEAKSLT